MSLDPVDLAAELIRFDTINPPGQEAACTDYLTRLLNNAGFHCETVLMEISFLSPSLATPTLCRSVLELGASHRMKAL
jgi:hypothetical protein